MFSCKNEDDNNPDKQSRIDIIASTNTLTTKNTSPINKGVNATFFAFNANTETLVSKGDYLSSTSGEMTGINNYIMYLLPDNYDFYGLSQNNASSFESLNNWTSSPLKNGIDYLWGTVKNKSVIGSKTPLTITFQHIMSMIYFELENGDNITINSVDSIIIPSPTEGAKLNLFNPEVIQANQFSNNKIKMITSGLNSYYYILPVKTTSSLSALFYLKINGQANQIVYNLNIQLPANGYQSGRSYLYKLSISETEIIIKAFTVSDWIINDYTDNPIFPVN